MLLLRVEPVLLRYQILRHDLNSHATLFVKCKVEIRYTDTKRSGSNISYFDVNDTLYIFIMFFIFAINSIIKSDVFTFQLMVLTVNVTFKTTLSENV